MRLRAVALVSAVALSLAGCSGGEDPVAVDPGVSDPASATPSPSESTGRTDTPMPDCRRVWVDGKKLPAGYDGCLEGDTAVAADKQTCTLGVPLVTYDGRFYAVAGNRINDVGVLKGNAQYQRARSNCLG